MSNRKYQVSRKLLLYSMSILLLTSPISSSAMRYEADLENQFTSSKRYLPNPKLDRDLDGALKQYKAKKIEKGSKVVQKIGKYVNYIGVGLSLIASIDPEPKSKGVIAIVGSVLNKAGVGVNTYVSRIVHNYGINVDEKGIKMSAPISISESIIPEIAKLEEERERLISKMVRDRDDKYIKNRITDRFGLTTYQSRVDDSETKYRKAINENKVKLDYLREIKADIGSSPMDHSKATRRAILEEGIGYYIEKIINLKNPEAYKEFIMLKEHELMRLR